MEGEALNTAICVPPTYRPLKQMPLHPREAGRPVPERPNPAWRPTPPRVFPPRAAPLPDGSAQWSFSERVSPPYLDEPALLAPDPNNNSQNPVCPKRISRRDSFGGP